MVAATEVTVDTALRTNGLTLPLKDGSVKLDGIKLNLIEVKPHIAIFRRMVRSVEFELAEVAPTTYMLSKRFNKQFTAIPVFISRGFHHGAPVVNPKSGIKTPKDLEGKRVGIRAYTVTANVWTIGMLKADYSVDPSKITWYTDDEDHVQEFKLPGNVVKVPAGKSLAGMMVSGEIDAAFKGNAGIGRAGAPVGDWSANADVEAAAKANFPQLIPNAQEQELEWYRRTGILPIHGIVVMRNSSVEANPWIAPEIYKGFKKAREIYLERLAAEGEKYSDDKAVLRLQKQLGTEDGALPFGFKKNLKSIQALIDFSYDQGAIVEKPRAEDLFFSNTVDLD